MTSAAGSTGTASSETSSPAPKPPPVGVPWPKAREAANSAAQPLPPIRVDLDDAYGATLAEAIETTVALPPFDTAAMDGYAVSGAGPWRIVGQVLAGSVWDHRLAAGEAVEISTGAQVPPGADAVLPVEYSQRDGATVSGEVAPTRTHIRLVGEDAPAGHLLAASGVRIGAALLGLAATGGHNTLLVRPRPRVEVLITGDELTSRGPSGAGLVRDALGPVLPPLVDELGGVVHSVRHVPDQPRGRLADALRQSTDRDGAERGQATGEAAGQAYGPADVVAVSGSTSLGATDQLRHVLHSCGAQWVVDTVACRPGHPQILARLPDGRWLVGLPGNPFAAIASAYTLLGPLLAGMSGRGLPDLPQAVVRGDIRPAPGLTRLLPVTWDGPYARVAGGHRAAFLHGAALANALAAIPADWTPDTPVPLVLTR